MEGGGAAFFCGLDAHSTMSQIPRSSAIRITTAKVRCHLIQARKRAPRVGESLLTADEGGRALCDDMSSSFGTAGSCAWPRDCAVRRAIQVLSDNTYVRVSALPMESANAGLSPTAANKKELSRIVNAVDESSKTKTTSRSPGRRSS